MTVTEAAMALISAIHQAHIKGQFNSLGREQLKAIQAKMPLSKELIELYQIAAAQDLYIPWSANYLVLYDPLRLEQCQIGYRWSEPFGKMEEGWNQAWLVIGDQGGDPIIAHTDQVGTPISMAIHGTGEWNPSPRCSKLECFSTSVIHMD